IRVPPDLTCLHGITVEMEPSFAPSPISARLDYRYKTKQVPLSRELKRRGLLYWWKDYPPEVWIRWEEILRDHLEDTPLAKSDDGWIYKQALIDFFQLPLFWASVSKTIPVYRKKEQELVTLNSIKDLPVLNVLVTSQMKD